MKYDKETTQLISEMYTAGKLVPEIAAALTEHLKQGTTSGPWEIVPDRSVIAKLSSLGIYKKKDYLTKRGEIPIKKEEYIEKIAALLDVNAEFLESLEKVNKAVLALIALKLS